MKLFKFRSREKTYKCARCKKAVKRDALQLIGDNFYCDKCVSIDGKPLPEYLLLRTASLLNDTIYGAKTITCAQCKSTSNTPYFYNWIGKQRLCLNCALNKLPILNGYAKINLDTPLYYYPVEDKVAEEEYWNTALNQANLERQKNKLTMPEDYFKRVDNIATIQYNDPDREFEINDITISVYANEQRTQWCFRLEHTFESGWDGWPVYNGGFITPEQFAEYMNRMGYTHHLVLFKNVSPITSE